MARTTRAIVAAAALALALAGAVPALANASVAWRLNGVPLTEVTPTTWKGTIQVTDTNVLGTSQGVECQDTAEGTTLPGGTSEITQWTASNCVPLVGNCAKTGITLEALNLAWNPGLVEAEGVIHDYLMHGPGNPVGFRFTCKTSGLQTEDSCKGTSIRPTATNTASGVTETFSASQKLTCTAGGSGAGVLGGSQNITSTSGKLSVQAEEPPVWLAAGAVISRPEPITWNGSLTLRDTTQTWGEVGVRCEDTGSGKAGAGAAGEMTKWTLSECVPLGNCLTSASIEALALPWHTELLEGAGELISETGGLGTPGFSLKCKVATTTISDECRSLPNPVAANTETAVNVIFSKKGFICSLGKAGAGHLEGTQATSLNNGERLQVRY